MTDPLTGGMIATVPLAMQWVELVMLGTVSTTIAVLAVAAIGWGLFTGRVQASRSVFAVVGCFVVFGAPLIARSLTSARSETNAPEEQNFQPAQQVWEIPQRQKSVDYDPYAGASVPIN